MSIPARTRRVSPYALLNRHNVPLWVSLGVGCYDNTEAATPAELADLVEALDDADLPPATAKSYATSDEVLAMLQDRPTDDLIASGKITRNKLAQLMRGETIHYQYMLRVKGHLLDHPEPTAQSSTPSQAKPPTAPAKAALEQLREHVATAKAAIAAIDAMLAQKPD